MESSETTQDQEVEARMRLVAQQLKLETKIRNGAGWFFWIAGLSAINTVVEYAGGSFRFIFGLGITQFIDVVASLLTDELTPMGAKLLVGASVFIDLVILGIFVVIGVFARRKKLPAFYIGTGLYLLDGIILAVIGDLLGVIFHVLAIFGILQGIWSLREYQQLPSDKLETQARVEQLLAEPGEEIDLEAKRRRFRQSAIAVGVALLMCIVCILVSLFS